MDRTCHNETDIPNPENWKKEKKRKLTSNFCYLIFLDVFVDLINIFYLEILNFFFFFVLAERYWTSLCE